MRPRRPGTGRKSRPAFCLFCRAEIPRPALIQGTPRRAFPGGRCTCGSSFVSDVTGKNGGEALVELLALACDGDMDRAWSLEQGRDYLLKVVSYDPRHHTFNRSGYFKDGMARLYFLQLLVSS